MRAKHDDLPTDRLVLVPASGFSKAAAAKARHYGIEIVTPGTPIADDAPPLARLGHPQVEFRDVTLEAVVALCGIVELDGGPSVVKLDSNHLLFASDGTELSRLSSLVATIVEGVNLRSAVAGALDGAQHLVVDKPGPRVPQTGSDPAGDPRSPAGQPVTELSPIWRSRWLRMSDRRAPSAIATAPRPLPHVPVRLLGSHVAVHAQAVDKVVDLRGGDTGHADDV